MLSSCDILGDSSFGSEDSGLQILIENYSDTEYNNYTFYMGYKDASDTFIAIDSLVFSNNVIYKNGDGNLYNVEEGFSLTRPFDIKKSGLNRYGYWEPDRETIKELSKGGRAYLKVGFRRYSFCFFRKS